MQTAQWSKSGSVSCNEKHRHKSHMLKLKIHLNRGDTIPLRTLPVATMVSKWLWKVMNNFNVFSFAYLYWPKLHLNHSTLFLNYVVTVNTTSVKCLRSQKNKIQIHYYLGPSSHPPSSHCCSTVLVQVTAHLPQCASSSEGSCDHMSKYRQKGQWAPKRQSPKDGSWSQMWGRAWSWPNSLLGLYQGSGRVSQVSGHEVNWLPSSSVLENGFPWVSISRSPSQEGWDTLLCCGHLDWNSVGQHLVGLGGTN